MRFKALPEKSQNEYAALWVACVAEQPPGIYPIAPAATWLRGLRHLNVRIGADGMPSAMAMVRVTDWVENLLFGPPSARGVCDCCGVEY